MMFQPLSHWQSLALGYMLLTESEPARLCSLASTATRELAALLLRQQSKAPSKPKVEMIKDRTYGTPYVQMKSRHYDFFVLAYYVSNRRNSKGRMKRGWKVGV